MSIHLKRVATLSVVALVSLLPCRLWSQEVDSMMVSKTVPTTYQLPWEEPRTTFWFGASIGSPMYTEDYYYNYYGQMESVAEQLQWSFFGALQYRTSKLFFLQIEIGYHITQITADAVDGSTKTVLDRTSIVGSSFGLLSSTRAPWVFEGSTGFDLFLDVDDNRSVFAPRVMAALRLQPSESPLRLRIGGGIVHGGLSLMLTTGFAVQ